MNLKHLKHEDVESAFRALRESQPSSEQAVGRLEEMVHELQSRRQELEKQNRILRDTQDELEQSVQRYSDLYDSLPIGSLTLGCDGQILEANLSAAELLGQPRECLVGEPLRRYSVEDDWPRISSHIDECSRSEQLHTMHATLIGREKQRIPVQLSSRRIGDGQGQLACVRMGITDVTALKRAEEELRETNAEQEAFTHSISHDLRAPLITITNYTEFLAEEHAAGLDEAGRDILNRVRKAAQRMDDVLQNLLLYSRVCRAEMKMGPVDVGNVITETLLQHQGVIEDRNAEIRLQGTFPPALASRDLLGQVLSNLLTNALKYTQPGRVPVVEISNPGHPEGVLLQVADEGIGIAQQDLERIFGMFERLHGQSVYPGTGIGLAVVRRAVDRMGGRIWVESQEGQGSRFFVLLPKAGEN